MNMNVVTGFRKRDIASWAKNHLCADYQVVSDGLSCFTAVTEAGCKHNSIITGSGPESMSIEAFTWVNTMIGNVKNALVGSVMGNQVISKC